MKLYCMIYIPYSVSPLFLHFTVISCLSFSTSDSFSLLFNTPPHLEAWAAGPAALPTAAQTPAWRGWAPAPGRAAGRGPSGERPQGGRPAPAPPRQSPGRQGGGQAQETQLSAGKQQRDEAEADHPAPGEVLLWHLTLTSPVPDGRRGEAPGISEVLEVAWGEKRASSGSWSTSLHSDLFCSPKWPGEVTIPQQDIQSWEAVQFQQIRGDCGVCERDTAISPGC